MPTTVVDGIRTRYEVIGSGFPVLMFSPGGFDATVEKWRTQGIYAQITPLDHLAGKYTCIAFDRRECGASGGRVEAISWRHYVAQAKGLLDHLGIARAHVLGACMGCSPAIAFGVAHPEATASLLLYWPVGGPLYRMSSHRRFSEHLTYAREHGLDAVVALAAREGKPFNQDPRGGPWAMVIHREPDFAATYARHDMGEYARVVDAMMHALFDRDTAPGAEPDDLLELQIPALIVPGRDKTHATSAARYLEECLPRSQYWDIPVADQTAAIVPPRILGFLGSIPT